MRIAHVTSYQVPGYGYEEIQLAREQERLGHEVEIFTSNYLHPEGQYTVLSRRFPERQVPPVVDQQGAIKVHRLASREVLGRVWIGDLGRALSDFDPDIVHCHNLLQFHPLRAALARRLRSRRYRIVVCDHMHSSVVRRSMAGKLFYSTFRTVVEPILDRSVNSFCAISEDSRRYLLEDCRVHQAVTVMPLGVDAEAFAADPPVRSRWRSEHGIEADELVVLYAGKLIEAKGPHLLVGAALRRLEAGDRLRLVLLGDADDEYVAAIRRRAADAGRSEAVITLPSVLHEALPPYYAGADICVWPRQESMALLEAMATSLPVVVSDESGYAKLVESGIGLTFRSDDEASLAAALERLQDPELRRRLGAEGRTRVEAEYSWRRSAERYLREYRRISGEKAVAADLP